MPDEIRSGEDVNRRAFLALAILAAIGVEMGFSDPVVGGADKLIRPAIQSPNFSHGVSGWTINKDGSAEFNNLTIRGEFDGTDFIINSAGAFFYSGTPAANNLIASIANNGGTDEFGNNYLPGVLSYFVGSPTTAVQLAVGQISWYISGSGLETGASPWTQYFSLNVSSPGVLNLLVQNFLNANAIFNIGSQLNVLQLLTANSLNIDGGGGQSTPAGGTNFQGDSSHNLNITGDGLGTDHLLIFNYDLTLRSAVTPSAPATGIRLTADASNNLVFTPSVAAFLKLVNSQLWMPAGNAFTAQATGMLIGSDSLNADRLQVMPPAGGQWNATLHRITTFPNNNITSGTKANLTSGQINANDAEIGATYELECSGNWTEATTTALSFTFSGGFGSSGTIVSQTISPSGFNAGGTGRFYARLRVTCVTTGVSGTWLFELYAIMCPNANPNNTVVICDTSAATATTADTTVNQSLQLQGNWASGTNNPSMTSRMSTFGRIN